MFEKTVIFLIIFFTALLQMSLFSNLLFWGITPNLMLLLVLFWITHEGFVGAFFKLIFAGWMLDLFTFQPIGINIFIFAILGFLSDSFAKRFLVVAKNWQTAILLFLVAINTLFFELMLFLLAKLGTYFNLVEITKNINFASNVSALAKKTIINMLFFFLISLPLLKIEQFLNLRRNRKKLSYV